MGKKQKQQHSSRTFLERCLQWGTLIIFAVLPLLYFTDRIASYITSKEYFFIGSVELLTVLWIWLLLKDKRYRLSKQNLFVLLPLFLFLASLTVSAIVGVIPINSFFSTMESGTGLVLLYHAFLFACIVASQLRVQQQKLLKQILQANLFASVVLAIATFFTGPNGLIDIHANMLDGSSGGAMMGNSLLAGSYLAFSLFLTIYLISQESKLRQKIIYWCSLVVMAFSPIFFNVAIFKGTALASAYLFIGEARVATVSVIIGLFLSLFIWLCTLKGKKAWRTVGIVGIISMLLVGGIAVQQLFKPTSRVHAFFVDQSGNRITDWQEAIQGIKARPLLGWGPENSHVVHQLYFNPIVFNPGHNNEAWSLHPHNNTLEVLENGGVIGLIFYLAVLAVLFGGLFSLYKKGRIDGKLLALFVGMLVAYLLQDQMVYDTITSYVMFFSVIAIVAGLIDTTDAPYPVAGASESVVYQFGIAAIVLMFPIWLYLAYFPSRKVVLLETIAAESSNDRTTQYQYLFHSAGSYAVDTDIEFFSDPLYYSYFAEKDQLRNNKLYQQVSSQEIKALIAAADPVWQSDYYDYHLSLSLTELENLEFYLTDDPQYLTAAETYAKRAFLLSPTDPQIYTEDAQILAYQGNITGAMALLNKAIALNPNYLTAVDFKQQIERNDYN